MWNENLECNPTVTSDFALQWVRWCIAVTASKVVSKIEWNQPSRLPDSFAHGRGAIETCFLAGRTSSEAESIDCVKQIVALTSAEAN